MDAERRQITVLFADRWLYDLLGSVGEEASFNSMRAPVGEAYGGSRT